MSKPPVTPSSDSRTIRIEIETIKRIEEITAKTGQTLNAFVVECVEKALESLSE